MYSFQSGSQIGGLIPLVPKCSLIVSNVIVGVDEAATLRHVRSKLRLTDIYAEKYLRLKKANDLFRQKGIPTLKILRTFYWFRKKWL